MTDAITAMRDTLRAEADALLATIDLVDDTWAQAVDLFDAARKSGARVVVCGVGKSGHVGRKIAASLASTGTPSLFIHGTEASHGDLGMILPGDAVLMISASGETAELVDTAAYCRARGVPLVLISRHRQSRLGRQAQIVLRLPPVAEACSTGLAPTTSSTAALAIGDAIMVALMRRAGFGRGDFGRLHPGGKLGDATRQVADLMIPADRLTEISGDASLQDAAQALAHADALRVDIEDAGPVGLDASAFLRLAADAGDFRLPLRTCLPRAVPTAAPTELVSDVRAAQPDARLWGLQVVGDGRLVGYVPAARL
jgi:arabinose-5-phosphate isomerase